MYSSAVIDHLLSQGPGIGVACLYADYKGQSNQTLGNILGCLLRQLLTTVPKPIPDEIIQCLQDNQRKAQRIEIKDHLALLKIRIYQLKRTFICIDAIDELEPTTLRQLLNALKKLNTSNTRLFLTGRGHVEHEVRKYFQVTPACTVVISASEQDIRTFVRQQIVDDLNLNPDAMDEILAQDIEDAILQKSQGM